jgi:hypothetical protein
MMLEEIGQLIEENAIAVQGSTLFLGTIPDSPDACVSLMEYGGMHPEQDMDALCYEAPSLQVTVRDPVYPNARAKIQQIINLLDRRANVTLGSAFYLRILANQSPFPLGQDLNDRHRLVVNFDIARKEA